MTVTTYDWDTVSAVHVTSMNEQLLRNADTIPQKFSSVDEEEMIRAEGRFSQWQINSGGDGHLIGLSTKVEDLKMSSLFGSVSGEANWSLFVSLHYVGGEVKANVQVMNLVIKDDNTDPSDPIVISRGIAMGSDNQYEFPEGTSEDEQEEYQALLSSMLEILLLNWLSTNIQQFRYVFNQANLNLLINPDDTWGWLKPTYIDYAYTENKEDFNQSIFSVLCMVNNHEVVNQPVAAEEQVIPKNQEFGFLINEERYIEDLLIPGILNRFPDAKREEITVNSLGEENKYHYEAILKPAAPLSLEEVEVKGKKYHPKMEKATFSLDNTQLIVEMETSTWLLSGDATGHTVTVQPFHMELDESSGGQTIKYTKDESGSSESNYVTGAPEEIIPSWLKILIEVVGVLLALLVPELGALIAMIVVGILNGLIDFLNEWNSINSSTAPNIEGLVDHVLTEIKWANQTVKLNIAEFFGAIRLGGNLA